MGKRGREWERGKRGEEGSEKCPVCEDAIAHGMTLPLTDVVKQLSSTDILHHHEDVSRCGDDLIQFNDVRMAEQLQ